MKKLLLCSIAVTLLAACTDSNAPNESRKPQLLATTPVAETEQVIEKFLSEQSSLLFRSRSGKLYGMDSDSDILFGTNHQAELTEYGFAVKSYQGTFSVDKGGLIVVSLPDYRGKWPTMRLSTAGDDFFLQPATGGARFVMGDRAGATETPEMAPFWPFKLIRPHIVGTNQNVAQ